MRRRELEFVVSDLVYLKVSPMKGKLDPPYVGPNKILRCIGNMAYELDFPADIASVFPVFMYPC